MQSTQTDTQRIYELLESVTDPEIPVLSIRDMGIIRDVIIENGKVTVKITPTYTGCPAMDMIGMQIKAALGEAGYDAEVETILAPAWSTDWMSEEGKQKLRAYGIAPPMPKQSVCNDRLFAAEEAIQCPRCDSWHTHRISEFGSTACKALYQCDDCKEPFDYFKCH